MLFKIGKCLIIAGIALAPLTFFGEREIMGTSVMPLSIGLVILGFVLILIGFLNAFKAQA